MKMLLYFIFNGYPVFFYKKYHYDTKQIHNIDINCIIIVYNLIKAFVIQQYNSNIYIKPVVAIIKLYSRIQSMMKLYYWSIQKIVFQIKIEQQDGLITALTKFDQSLQIQNVYEILQRLILNIQTLEELDKANIRSHSGFLLDFLYLINNLIIRSFKDYI
ncbi:unnamed protein product [Paramecium sonneborni]|uniref:Uncharacterized protein n=1 Tax=Paramecium sonneborni TaxID=65129 RepID=A0A8S1PI17_9CILI|nr:unnamed protein product [Paramecium sonneborni]